MSAPVITENKKKIKHGFLTVVTGRTFLIVLLLLIQLGLLVWGFERLGEYIHLGSAFASAVMLIYIMNTDSDPTVKLTWSFIIALVPVLGIPLYFYIKLDLGHRAVQKSISRQIAETAAYFPLHPEEDRDVTKKLRETLPEAASISRYLTSAAGFPPYEHSEVTYFPVGERKFEAMLQDLESAKSFIFMEYFILSPGRMWDAILDILKRKVKEGVEVRFMYDGTCAFGDLPYSYPRELEAIGIRCKMFAPVRPLVSTHYNNRDHRKILVVDGKVAYTGGVNIGDEYINQKPRFGHWKDTAIRIRGEAVRSFTLMFLQMWNANERTVGCCYDRYLPAPEDIAVDAPGAVIPYGDSPMDRERVGETVYLHLLNTARDYVWIMTPYLILDGETVAALTIAAKRGVDVRLILPHIPDKKYAFWLAKSHYRELVEAGVKLYEYTPGFVHAKVFLADGRMGTVGTVNLDYRSLYHHFECGALLIDTPCLADIRADFEDTLQKSHRVTREDIAHEKFHVKFFGGLLKIVAPLM